MSVYVPGALFVHEPASDVDPLHLMAYCRTLGVKFIYEDKIKEQLQTACSASSSVRWSSHSVRRRVYGVAASQGFSAAAVAQTLDRAAAAFLVTAFHGAALNTLTAHYRVKEHNIRILRPFIYVRSQDLEHFARSQGLPDFGRDLSDKPVLGPSKNKLDRSISLPCGSDKGDSLDREEDLSGSLPELVDPMSSAREILKTHEKLYPYLFSSLKNALHPLISGRNIEKDNRHRKKSVIQMKNGSPVYDSEEGTEEEPVP
ncbi:putative Y71H2B.5 [Danaus plexippus plexippus]|uniref:Y71H2B.5 n=1 Tax=Danaus plexippus plexippus TaxID=278856 RepID=A0A212ESR5_DANPL|nr:putative Y71H2B.5 [Danaus plexippus plexippus]